MGIVSNNLPVFGQGRVSQLAAFYEGKIADGTKTSPKTQLTTASSAASGVNPHKIDHFSPSLAPSAPTSPQNEACRQTAATVHDAIVTEHVVQLSTPLEMSYSEHIETTLELKRPPNPQITHQETVITLSLPMHVEQSEHVFMEIVVDLPMPAKATNSKALEEAPKPLDNLVVVGDKEEETKNNGLSSATAGTAVEEYEPQVASLGDTGQPEWVNILAGGIENKNADISEMTKAMGQMLETIASTPEEEKTISQAKMALELTTGVKGADWYVEVDTEVRTMFDAVHDLLTQTIAEHTASTAPTGDTGQPEWANALAGGVGNKNADVSEMTKAMGQMLETIASTPDDEKTISQAKMALELTTGVKGADWYGEVDTEVRTMFDAVHELLTQTVAEHTTNEFISTLTKAGKFNELPQRYEGFSISLFNWAQQEVALEGHQTKLSQEIAFYQQNPPQTDSEKLKMATAFDSRQRAIAQGNKNIEAAKSIVSNCYTLLKEDLAKLKEMGADQAHPEVYNKLDALYAEISALIEPDGKLHAPDVQKAGQLRTKYFETSPGGVAQEIQSRLQESFAAVFLYRETNIEISKLLYVMEVLKLQSPVSEGAINTFIELSKNYKRIIEESSRELRSMTDRVVGADPFIIPEKKLSASQKQALSQARTQAHELLVGAERLAQSGIVDEKYKLPLMQSIGALPARIKEFINQLNNLEKIAS